MFFFLKRKLALNVVLNLSILLLNIRFPFIKGLIKRQFFNTFVGGENLNECIEIIENLKKHNISVILDYGKEGAKSEDDFVFNLSKFLETIFFARDNDIKFIAIKVSALSDTDFLTRISKDEYQKTENDEKEYHKIVTKLNTICKIAFDNNIKVLIDAEESWIQKQIDVLCLRMMKIYNKEEAIVFNTVQLYRKDKLEYLKKEIDYAEKENFYYGVKIVRGAYLEKESIRAKKLNYESPLHKSKIDCDSFFNRGLEFCFEKLKCIELIIATHNEASTEFSLNLMKKLKVKNSDSRVHFSQLFGMVDNLSYTLSKYSYNTLKYLPYGLVKDLVPYLKRRVNENSSIVNQSFKEVTMIENEIRRRINI